MMKDGRLSGAMDTGLYIAASGMLAQQVREDQLANDLSNASTPGYKTDASVQSDFGSMLLANTATGQPIGQINTGVQLGTPVTNMTPTVAAFDWPATRLRDRGDRLLRRAHLPRSPLHPRRPVRRERPGPARRRTGQRRALPERRPDRRQRPRDRPGVLARRVQRQQPHQAGRQLLHRRRRRPRCRGRQAGRARGLGGRCRSTRWST